MLRFSFRVYAVTGRNKFIGGLLALLVFAQGCQGLFSVVWIGLFPRKSRRFDRLRMGSSAPSATVARDKLGCVQVLYLQTMETRGTHVLPHRDRIRYALALRPSVSFHPEGLIRIKSWHHRYCCVLDHSNRSQEIACDWTSEHTHHLGHHCTGRDALLRVNIHCSTYVRVVRDFCPGG